MYIQYTSKYIIFLVKYLKGRKYIYEKTVKLLFSG